MYIFAIPVVAVLYVAVRLLHARSVAKRDKWAEGPWHRFYWKWCSDTPASRSRRSDIPKNIGAVVLFVAIGAVVLGFFGFAAWDVWTAGDKARIEQWQGQVPPPLPPNASEAEQQQHSKAMAEWLAKDPRITHAEKATK